MQSSRGVVGARRRQSNRGASTETFADEVVDVTRPPSVLPGGLFMTGAEAGAGVPPVGVMPEQKKRSETAGKGSHDKTLSAEPRQRQQLSKYKLINK